MGKPKKPMSEIKETVETYDSMYEQGYRPDFIRAKLGVSRSRLSQLRMEYNAYLLESSSQAQEAPLSA